jgi:photosystem II stability/assembly factor-like uncharacterized protein
MNTLENLPVGPKVRLERTEADKSVFSVDVREAHAATSAHPSRDLEPGASLKKRRPVYRRAAVISTFSAAALLMVIAILATPALREPGSARGRVVSPSRKVGGAQSWRLVSELSPSWRTLPSASFEPGGLPTVTLDCPTTTTCYVGNFARSGGATAVDVEVEVEVTDDDGATWRRSTLPVTLSRPPSIFCLDVDTCAILGNDGSGDSTFLNTTDGGRTWSAHAGPEGLNSMVGPTQLACTSAMACIAVAPGPDQTIGQVGAASAYMSGDGGETWSTSSLPIAFFPSALQCTTLGTCVASGFQVPSGIPGATGGRILYTTDDGSTWTAAVVPSGLSAFNSLSCAESGTCLAIFSGVGGSPAEVLSSTDGGKTWVTAVPTGFLNRGVVMSLSCPDTMDCWVTGVSKQTSSSGASVAIDLHIASGFVGSTSDSGKAWQGAQLPRGVGALLDVSCPDISNCYAVGLKQVQRSTDTPQPFVLLAYGGTP